eukprot:m.18563 g.18563  ORF g.18563 m.18563 type:complete len:63 (-) comp7911_c0_seq1:137-325(-)
MAKIEGVSGASYVNKRTNTNHVRLPQLCTGTETTSTVKKSSCNEATKHALHAQQRQCPLHRE